MKHAIQFEQEEDGRWIAEIPSLHGVMVYASSQAEAARKAEALAEQMIADRS